VQSPPKPSRSTWDQVVDIAIVTVPVAKLEKEKRKRKSTNAKPETRRCRIKAVGTAQNDLSAGAKIIAAIEEATKILWSERLASQQLKLR
jgi:hypothetical protein